MPLWYFEKSELLNTPSIRDGLDADTESRYRREGTRFLTDCGNGMGLRYDTLATGAVFFHRFYMFHSFNEFPRYLMATCCLFLAGKVEETPKKCRDLIKAARAYLESRQLRKHAELFADEPQCIKEIMTYEKILLQTIKFDLQVEHPYAYLLKYAKTLKCGEQEQIRKMVQMAWAFINDSYCTTLCLQWEPEIIAIALMYLTSRMSKIEITDWLDKKPEKSTAAADKQRWWDQFVENLDLDILEDICHQILDLYASQQKQQQPTSSNTNTRINQNNQSNNMINRLAQSSSGTNGASFPITPNNKRKSPPEPLELTNHIQHTASHPNYSTEPASPTSAKLMRTISEGGGPPPPPPPSLPPPPLSLPQVPLQYNMHHPPPPPPPVPPPAAYHHFPPPYSTSASFYQAPPPPPGSAGPYAPYLPPPPPPHQYMPPGYGMPPHPMPSHAEHAHYHQSASWFTYMNYNAAAAVQQPPPPPPLPPPPPSNQPTNFNRLRTK